MSLKKTWSRLSPKDRQRWIVVGTALTVGLYGLLVFPFATKSLTESKSLLARRLDRLEKRASVPKVDAASAAVLQGRLTKLETEREALAAKQQKLGGRFAPAGAVDAQQKLLLELTTLADSCGIQVLRQGAEASKGVPSLQTDKLSGRPVMKVQATGDYWGVLAFLKRLDELSFDSMPLGLELASDLDSGQAAKSAGKDGKQKGGAAAGGGQTRLNIVLSLTL